MDSAPTIGHNAPPHIRHAMTIDELADEGKAWMTGAAIPDADAAKDFAAFLDRVVAAEKAAQADKEAEYRPHKDAADAVTAAYKAPLDTAKRVIGEGKKLISDFERRRAAEQRRIAEAAAAEAARIAQEAREALRASAGDLEAREEAEALVVAAKTQEIAAKVIAKQDDRVVIGGRRVAMREFVEIEVTNETALLKWAWVAHRDELIELATELARKDAKAGAAHIDGVKITKERRAA